MKQPIRFQKASSPQKPAKYAYITLADKKFERSITNTRMYIFIGLVVLSFSALIARTFYLQVVSHAHYAHTSDKNRISKQPIAPNRGRIFDSQGNLLATNHPVFNLYIDADYLRKNASETLQKLQLIIDINEQDLLIAKNNLSERKQKILLKNGLSRREEATVLANSYLFPWLKIERNLQRHYVEDELFAHAIGYVGRIDKQEWRKLDKNIYQASYLIGKTNIEKFYEDVLRGTPGISEVEVDAYGRLLNELGAVPAKNGADIQLYLDYSLQKKAAQLLANKRGCMVALDPNTGGILAVISSPTFNAESFVKGISSKNYSTLSKNSDIPLFNRCFAGRYAPASMIKPFLGLVALESNTINKQYAIWDPGWFQLDSSERRYRNWRAEGHGNVDLHKAIVVSNDTYFYELGYRMTINNITKQLSEFGFGNKVGLDIDQEKAGLLPSREWKKKHHRQDWFAGDTINIGIGQGYMLVTPLQITYATSIIANRGGRVFPRFVHSINSQPITWKKDRLPDLAFNPAHLGTIINALRDVMHSPHGTGYRHAGRLSRYTIAGKTGTGQVKSIEQDAVYDPTKLKERHLDHSLFTGFAPIDAPQIVITVIVENSGSGGSTAAPIATQLINHYLDCRAIPSAPKCLIKK